MITGAPVNVKDYGALGDGVTNDAAAFGLALTAASGSVLEIPSGTYQINSALTIPANTTVTGYGATLDFSSAGNIAALVLESNVKLFGFKLLGPSNVSYNGNSIGIKCYGTDNSPSAPTYVTGPTLQDLFVTEFAGQGVDCKYNNNGKISDCRVTECGYTGIQILSSNRFQITNNYVGQITPGASGNAYGISISSSEGSVISDPIPFFNEITGNIVEDVTVWTGIDTHGGDTIVISNNIVQNCKLGIKLTDRDIGAVRTIAPKNIVVSGNYINDNNLFVGSAIVINGAITGSGTTTDYATNISITGNTILGHGEANNDGAGAIRCYSTKNLTISGNNVRRPKVVGIVLDFDNESFSINGNTIVDPQDSTETTRCVYLRSNNNLGSIVGNTFVLESTLVANNVSQWGVENGLGAGTTNIVTVESNNLANVQPNYLQMSESFALRYNAGDTSPSVKNTVSMGIANASPTTITNFDDGYDGQVISLNFSDSNTTINRTNAYLDGGVNFTSTANDTLVLKKLGVAWYEISRSLNN
jgi:parallel beta-helix repeat protein